MCVIDISMLPSNTVCFFMVDITSTAFPEEYENKAKITISRLTSDLLPCLAYAVLLFLQYQQLTSNIENHAYIWPTLFSSHQNMTQLLGKINKLSLYVPKPTRAFQVMNMDCWIINRQLVQWMNLYLWLIALSPRAAIVTQTTTQGIHSI